MYGFWRLLPRPIKHSGIAELIIAGAILLLVVWACGSSHESCWQPFKMTNASALHVSFPAAVDWRGDTPQPRS
jgi:hypothetical protein